MPVTHLNIDTKLLFLVYKRPFMFFGRQNSDVAVAYHPNYAGHAKLIK